MIQLRLLGSQVAIKDLPAGGNKEHVGANVKLRALKLSNLLLALNDLLNNDCLMQHCSDPRLISSQLCHATLTASPFSALPAQVLIDPTGYQLDYTSYS
jgi:hypothetical protein